MSVIGPIRSVCSARPMNSSGGTKPYCGWSHRTSASSVSTEPSAMRICGWKLMCRRCRSRASLNSESRFVRPCCGVRAQCSYSANGIRVRFALYIATSAARTRSPLVTPSLGAHATPMLTPAVTGNPCSANGNVRRSCRSVTRSCGDRRGCRTSKANSSPPRRATAAPSGRAASRRSAKATSRASPIWCPRRSFTSLNPLRSMSMTRALRPWPTCTASSTRSRNARRLSRPVS